VIRKTGPLRPALIGGRWRQVAGSGSGSRSSALWAPQYFSAAQQKIVKPKL
jgi:hypothetical protein